MNPDDQLKQLLRYSQKMLAAAKRDGWNEVADLEQARRELMAIFFDGKNSQAVPVEALRQALIELKQNEAEMVALAMRAKDQLAEDIQQLGTSRKAVNAYENNA